MNDHYCSDLMLNRMMYSLLYGAYETTKRENADSGHM